MPTLEQLKRTAETLCPYPVGPWQDLYFDRRRHMADSAYADTDQRGVTVSVMLEPPPGKPQIVMIRSGTEIELLEDEDPGTGRVQLTLF